MIRFKLMTVPLLATVAFATAMPVWADDAMVSGLPCNSLCRAWMSMGQADPSVVAEPAAPLARQSVEDPVAAKPGTGAVSASARTVASKAVQAVPLPPPRPRAKPTEPRLQVATRAKVEPVPRAIVTDVRLQAPSLTAAPAPALRSPFGTLVYGDVSTVFSPIPISASPAASASIAEPVAPTEDVASPTVAAEPKPSAVAQLPSTSAKAASPDVASDARPDPVSVASPQGFWAPPFDVIGALILKTPPARKDAAALVAPVQ